MAVAITFVQIHTMHDPKSEPNINYVSWVIMMYHYRFTLGKKCSILMSDLIKADMVHVSGQGLYEKSLYFPLNFVVDLNLLQKED